MLKDHIRYEKGVGPKISSILGRLGIETVNDLLFYFSKGYEDRNNPTPISKLVLGEEGLLKVKISQIKDSRTKRNFSIVKAIISDNSGKIEAVWFNQPFLLRVLKPGIFLYLNGKLDRDVYSGNMVFVPKEYDIIKSKSDEAGVIPKYSLTEGITNKFLRKIVKAALDKYQDQIVDNLPQQIKEKYKLQDLKNSIYKLHFPSKIEEVSETRRRVAFDELLEFQMKILYNRKSIDKKPGIKFDSNIDILDIFERSLPFSLTAAQKKVISDIKADMGDTEIMNRLIQGDVGSGKTIVALYAMLIAVANNYQAAIMAPTEILANQHYNKLSSMLKDQNIEVKLLTGNIKSDRKETYEKIKDGGPMIIVGTHALIEDKLNFSRLGLVVIDEQHRFGVEQRLKLRKKGENTDLLVMTATPIPRTLALTIYGDLDRSVIDEMPPGRTKIITRFIRSQERQKLYAFIKDQVVKGRQVYVVCPLVEESETLDLKNAKEEVDNLKKVFPDLKIGLIHGRMKSTEKSVSMNDFSENKVNILVSTTVIEVGIDVPNATIMLIEHSERFGLSQLHQLRGRIGRGQEQSYCFLAGEPKSETSKGRIDAMLATTDGFKIAEADLRLRGPGEILGARQWGLPNFRVADIINDEELIRISRQAAEILIKEGIFLGIDKTVTGDKLE